MQLQLFFLCFIFLDYFLITYADNWFQVSHTAITHFHIIPVEYSWCWESDFVSNQSGALQQHR